MSQHQLELIIVLAFIAFSIGSVVEDLRCYHLRINELILGGVIILSLRGLSGSLDIVEVALGGILGGAAFWAVHVFSRGRLGAGDIWYSAFIGITFGFWVWDLAMFLGALTAAAWLIIRALFSGRQSAFRQRIPFAPFMFVGSILSYGIKGLGI